MLFRSVTAIGDRVRDRASGRAPVNGTLRVAVSDCRFVTDCAAAVVATVPRDAKGRWVLRHGTTFDARGVDELEARWTSPAGDRFVRTARYPALFVNTTQRQVAGIAIRAGVPVTVTARPGPNEPPSASVSTTADKFRTFYADLSSLVSLTHVTVAADIAKDASLTIPTIDRGWDAGTRAISGHCLPFLPIRLQWGAADDSVEGVTKANGWFTVTLRPAVTGPAGAASIVVFCESAQGDLIIDEVTP